MTTTKARSRRTRLSLVLLAPLFALVALGCWALASPVGSSPDDDYHLASIWCAQGTRDGLCEPASNPNERMVSKEITQSFQCYANKPDQSAGCLTQYSDANPAPLVVATRGNFNGTYYPAVYYWMMSGLASPNVAVSTLVIRLVNIVLFVGVNSLLFALLPRERRSNLILPWLVTMVPLGMFIVASVNPSSWTMLSAGTVWIALVGYFESTGRRRIGLGTLAIAATVIGAGARADAAVYAGLSAVIAVVLTMRRSRDFWRLAILPGVVIAVSFALYLTANQASDAGRGVMGSHAMDTAASIDYLIGKNLLDLPLLWAGIFGSMQLGWLDTPMPGVVTVLALAIFAGVAFTGLARRSRGKLLSLAAVAGALVVLPLVVFVQSKVYVGYLVQPRYMLPLLVIFIGLAIFHARGGEFALTRLQLAVVVTVVSVLNAIALHSNMRRYITGSDVFSVNLNASREWWWNMPVTPMVISAVGAVSFAAFAFIIARTITARPALSTASLS